ncbi:LysR family transcriptional regulator [Comamonas testosteroni]|uniref:LysR family transcriptional regulator n=2 Tax=Comamonadaceae TaxID=80864 RepID=UPI001E33B345|nr:LysR family transcriptional regulator [Comamonas testosteroni]
MYLANLDTEWGVFQFEIYFPMNLRTLDLNLLRVFDAVFTERSMSKAADRLHLSQPTVSNAMARLREKLGDPLFERSSSGMTPTSRAKLLAEPVRQALALIERGLEGESDFDYAHADREFVVAVEDYGESVILPSFIDWLSQVAPGLRVRISPSVGTQILSDLREGRVDLALDYFPSQDPSVHQVCVLTDTLLAITRRHHPQMTERLTLETYLDLHHVVRAHDGKSRPMIDLALAKRGLSRRISATVPHFLSMPLMVQTSQLIATLPRRMALLYADNFPLQTHTVPLRVPTFPVYLLWHSHADHDAGLNWFRQHLIELCRRL